MKITKEELLKNLEQFCGTETYYQHISGKCFTAGVKYLADNAECYWLLDKILFTNRSEPFQVWKLLVQDQTGTLTMIEDIGCPELVKQRIPYTDFPLDSITLWLIDGILILPNEY